PARPRKSPDRSTTPPVWFVRAPATGWDQTLAVSRPASTPWKPPIRVWLIVTVALHPCNCGGGRICRTESHVPVATASRGARRGRPGWWKKRDVRSKPKRAAKCSMNRSRTIDVRKGPRRSRTSDVIGSRDGGALRARGDGGGAGPEVEKGAEEGTQTGAATPTPARGPPAAP